MPHKNKQVIKRVKKTFTGSWIHGHGAVGVGHRLDVESLQVAESVSQVPLPLILPSYYTFPVLPTLSALCQTHTCSNSNTSAAKPMAFALFHTLAPTSGTTSPKTSGTLLLSLPSKANSRHFSCQNISAKQHCQSSLSVCTVCVCACVHACVRVCAGIA